MNFQTVEGWLAPHEGRELQRLAKDKRVLEIGTWKGKSAIAMAETAKHVTTIDHFKGDGYTNGKSTFEEVICNLTAHNALLKVGVVKGDFKEILPRLNAKDFGLIYYDADHTGASTEFALNWIKDNADLPNTDVAVHDYANDYPHYRDAYAAITRFAQSIGRKIRLIGVLAVMEKQ